MSRIARTIEQIVRCGTRERAINAGVKWLEARGGPWGGDRDILLGKGIGGSKLSGREIGIRTTDGTHREIRLDWDPEKGPHYNAAAGKGAEREKVAFLFDPPEGFTGELGEAWVAGFKETKNRE